MENQRWCCLVDSDRQLFEWENSAGRQFFESEPELVNYAQAFCFSPAAVQLQQIAFYFRTQTHGWLKIGLSLHQQKYCLIYAEKTLLPFELSERELQIITLVSHGLSNPDIADALFISNRTVAKHLEHIFAKTKTENRTLLAIFALQHHLHCLPTSHPVPHSILPIIEIERLSMQLAAQQAVEKPQIFAIQANKARPIMIGVPFVESGLGQIDTQELLNGTQLAIEQINQHGGIQGREVQMVKAGYRVDDKTSIFNAYRSLFEQEVEAISTNYACYSPDVHELVAREGIPYLHDASHSGSDKSGKVGNIFQVCASSSNYGLGVVRFLQAYQHQFPQLIKQRKVVIITVKWQQIDIGTDTLAASLRKLNWAVEWLELEKSEGVFERLMPSLHTLEPDLIVFASYFTEDIVAFYAAFIAQPLDAIIYAIYAPSTLQPDQKLCEGVLWATTTGLPSTYAGRQFNRLYQQRFGEMPSFSQASLAFDQVNILANVWRQADFPRHFQQVNQGIRSLVSHGINGAYFLGNEHQIGLTYPDNTTDLSISQPHLIYQIQRGRNTVIAPSLFAESQFQLPPWFKLKGEDR